MSDLKGAASECFARRYEKVPALLVRAPGRVNLIGEHTDYNEGFVMPMAIDRAVWLALTPRTDRLVRVYSEHIEETGEFSLECIEKEDGWLEYVKGVAWALQSSGYAVSGFDGAIVSDVPVGSGLSSSAALELATAKGFSEVSGFEWDAVAMAKLGQRVENEWIGAKTGIMDQLISATAKRDFAQLIDCRSLALEPVALPRSTCVVIMDTMTRHTLVGSEYNDRRMQCELAAKTLGVPALRDANASLVREARMSLGDVTYRRARHVVCENARTLEAANAMRNGDASTLGALMAQSHASLRDDFEVTNDALNLMVDCANDAPGCYGARMTGGGFGGCAIALVENDQKERFEDKVRSAYRDASGQEPSVFACVASEGAQTLR